MKEGLKQVAGDKRCVSFVAAMATGTTPEEFEQFVAEMNGYNRREPPYEDIHIYSYLLSKGLLCGLGFVAQQPKNGAFQVRYDVMDHPAYLVVEGRGTDHAIYWDGTHIFDPDPNTRNGKDPNDYKIKLWVPIYRVENPPSPPTKTS